MHRTCMLLLPSDRLPFSTIVMQVQVVPLVHMCIPWTPSRYRIRWTSFYKHASEESAFFQIQASKQGI